MRTEYCGNLNKDFIGKEVTLTGWVNRRRDHGGVIFLDLRDKKGLCQIVINPENNDAFKIGEKVRSEFVLQVTGQVIARDDYWSIIKFKLVKLKSLPIQSTYLMNQNQFPFRSMPLTPLKR